MIDFLSKINQLDIEINNPQVHRQAGEVNAIISDIQKGKIIPKAPQLIGFLPDQMEEISNQLTASQVNKFKIINQLFNNLRQFLSVEYGVWSLPNLSTANLIKKELNVSTGLEIMAGNAYWSKALSQAGIKMIATDSLEWSRTSQTGLEPLMPVFDFDAEAAIKRYNYVDLVICSWAPNFGQSDEKAIISWKKYNPQSHFLFVGEKNGATNSHNFWRYQKFDHSPQLQRINQSFNSFDFINERIFEIAHEI